MYWWRTIRSFAKEWWRVNGYDVKQLLVGFLVIGGIAGGWLGGVGVIILWWRHY